MQCALRWVCLHLSCWSGAQSVPVWDRWLAPLPKVPLLFCALYLILIQQTALTVCVLFCLLCVWVWVCVLKKMHTARAHDGIIPCLCARPCRHMIKFWTGAKGVLQAMLSWEIESGKCSGVKALPRWIHRRGDTHTPAAKWCRSSLCLRAVRLVQTHTHSWIHTRTLWEPLTGPLQRLKAVISSLVAPAQ